jgi:hypothetical protein
MRLSLAGCVSLLLLLVQAQDLTYLDSKTYQGIKGKICFRLLSSKGAVGCSTTSAGRKGILYYINTAAEFRNFVEKSANYEFAVVMPYSLFSKFRFINSERMWKK